MLIWFDAIWWIFLLLWIFITELCGVQSHTVKDIEIRFFFFSVEMNIYTTNIKQKSYGTMAIMGAQNTKKNNN